ncbi:DUF1877 family protein [Dactylosporangium sp. CA-152071]|uniref:DUF1877 family protein n=1 Tax=Dactylosporangium sp. CA-152071 TaxID=3239933 RepID=UPI003D906B88
MAYDSSRLFTADDVAQAAHFLTNIPFTALAQHYAPADLIAADIYPAIWDEDWALSYLEDASTRLVALLRAATADHEPILVWIS